MGKEEYRVHIKKLIGSIENEKVLKLIYEITNRLFLSEYPEVGD